MTDKSGVYEILWHCSLLASSEQASLIEMEEGCRLRELAALPLRGEPCHIDYDVLCDPDWIPKSCRVNVVFSARVRTRELRRDGIGRWEHNGTPAPDLESCSDIDLGWTPATNTIPIRRLELEVGDTASIRAAWVRCPVLDVVANQQHYTRMSRDRWRYRSDDYDFELVTMRPPVSFLNTATPCGRPWDAAELPLDFYAHLLPGSTQRPNDARRVGPDCAGAGSCKTLPARPIRHEDRFRSRT